VKKLHLKKGQIIQRAGEFNHKVYVVESGLLRSYTIDKNGKEKIFMFAPEGWNVAAYASPEEASYLFIDALEASTVIELTKDLRREEKNIAPIVKRLSVMQKRIIMLLSTHAIERYEHFIQTYPDIAKRIPQKMIASYLGVNPETLSAAKRAWLKKK